MYEALVEEAFEQRLAEAFTATPDPIRMPLWVTTFRE